MLILNPWDDGGSNRDFSAPKERLDRGAFPAKWKKPERAKSDSKKTKSGWKENSLFSPCSSFIFFHLLTWDLCNCLHEPYPTLTVEAIGQWLLENIKLQVHFTSTWNFFWNDKTWFITFMWACKCMRLFALQLKTHEFHGALFEI